MQLSATGTGRYMGSVQRPGRCELLSATYAPVALRLVQRPRRHVPFQPPIYGRYETPSTTESL